MKKIIKYLIAILVLFSTSCSKEIKFDFPVDKDNYPLNNYIKIDDEIMKLDEDILNESNIYEISYSTTKDMITLYLPEFANHLRWMIDTDVINSYRMLVNENTQEKEGQSPYLQVFEVEKNNDVFHLKLVNINEIEFDFDEAKAVKEISISLK